MKNVLVVLVVAAACAIGWFLVSPLFIDQEVDEAFPSRTEVMDMRPAEREKAMKDAMAKAAAMPDKSMEEPMPASGPEALSKGSFSDIDAVHKGSGDATLYKLGDGGHVVRFENFRVANGPDLYVYLAEHENPRTAADVEAGYVSLGKLKGNVGSQNYAVPAGVDVGKYRSVVIWCQLFGVLFSPAPLS